MEKILVAYATNSGTTADVAKAVGEELGKDGTLVEVRLLEEVSSLEGYTAVVVGAPMIMGPHRAALKFIRQHVPALSQVKTAYFLTAMSLTDTGTTQVDRVPVTVDPGLARLPKRPGRLGFKERYATASNYLRPVLKAAPAVKPVGAAIFGGRLDMYRLKWYQALFVLLVIQAAPGEKRNWAFIREWAGGVRSALR